MVKPTDKLLAGHRSFKAQHHEQQAERAAELAESQHPGTLVIACSDSRVDPAILFNAEPGEIFVVRNVAALVPPYQPDDPNPGEASAIEYSVKALGVSDVVILGHHRCGGIAHMCNIASGRVEDPFEFVGNWVHLAEEGCAAHSDGDAASAAKAEQAAIATSVRNLQSYPWIQERVAAGSLSLHGWWYDITNGDLLALDPETGSFAEAK